MVELNEFRDGKTAARAVADAGVMPGLGVRSRGLFRWFNAWLWAFVLLPTLIAGVYCFGIASDLYMSEAKFIVRTGTRGPATTLGSLLASTGISRSQDDTFSVHDFITSRDAVRDLEKNADLRGVFNRPETDFVTKFPNVVTGNDTFEALFKHYEDFVTIGFDSTTGVSTLRVKAYRAEDARNIAQALLTSSEALVNRLNERAQNDALETARREVAGAEERVASIQGALSQYRTREKMLDPTTASSGLFESIRQMGAARITAATELADLMHQAPNNPKIPLLRTRIANLDAQMETERVKLTGQSDSVVSKIAGYERLSTDRELAQKALASAFASLEAARIEAQRQQLYLEHVVQPNLADYPLYPKRFISFLTVVACCLITYGTAWLLVASVREHASA